MSLAESRRVIEQRFIDNWSRPHVTYENLPYTPPDEDHWLRFLVQFISNELNGFGECRELIGMVSIEIFSPVRQGTAEQEQMIDEALAIFKGSHNEIAYQDAQVSVLGEVDGWYQCNLFIGFITTGNLS